MTALTKVLAGLSLFLTVTGCASSKPAGLPAGAALVAEGGSRLTFTAQEKGTLFLRDSAADQVINTFPLDPGQTVIVDPKSHTITRNGAALDAAALREHASYQLFFKATNDSKRQYHPMYNP